MVNRECRSGSCSGASGGLEESVATSPKFSFFVIAPGRALRHHMILRSRLGEIFEENTRMQERDLLSFTRSYV